MELRSCRNRTYTLHLVSAAPSAACVYLLDLLAFTSYVPDAVRICLTDLRAFGLFGAGDRIRTCVDFRLLLGRQLLSTSQPHPHIATGCILLTLSTTGRYSVSSVWLDPWDPLTVSATPTDISR